MPTLPNQSNVFHVFFFFKCSFHEHHIIFPPSIRKPEETHTHNLCVKKMSQFKFNLEVSTKYRGKQTSQP